MKSCICPAMAISLVLDGINFEHDKVAQTLGINVYQLICIYA